MRQARRDKRVLFNESTRGCRLILSLLDICKDSKASYTRQRKSLDSFQTGWYQSETCVQRSRKHRHALRGFLRIMSQLLTTKIWIPSD